MVISVEGDRSDYMIIIQQLKVRESRTKLISVVNRPLDPTM